jgi:hypothetical protein
MGQLFDKAGGLTVPNSAISDPDTGQTQAVNPKLFSQIRDQGALDRSAQSIAPQPAAPTMSAGPNGQPQFSSADVPRQTYKPPQPFQPSFIQAATAGAQPGGVNALSPQLSKLGKLGVLLTQGVQGALAGRAANEEATVASGGRRSGGIGMAMEAGYNLPFLRSLQQQKVQQGQAETAETQAKTEQTEAQTQLLGTSTPVTMPDGRQVLIPNSQLGQYLKGGLAAETNADSRENVQGMKGATAMSVEQMKFAIQNGQVARVEDGIDPESGQPAKIAYDRMGRRMGVLPGSLPSSSYLPTGKSSTDPLGLTTTSTTTKQLPQPGVGSSIPNRPTARPANRPAGGGNKAAGGGTIDSTAQDLVEGNTDPSLIPKRSAAYLLIEQKAKQYSQQKYGQPFDMAQAAQDYQYAKNPQTQNTLKMINAMTDKGGSIEIAQKAAAKLPQLDSQTLNKVFNAAATEFGSPSATNFHTAMLGLADEYSKVMGGGVSSDTGRQQGLDLLKNAYSKGQLSGAIGIMQQDIAARKNALVGSNRYLMKQYGQTQRQSSGKKVLVEGVDF